PDLVWILTVDRLLNEGRDGVACVELAGPIYGQAPANRGFEASFRVEDPELQLTHQLGEPVQFVAAVPSLPRAQSFIFPQQMPLLVQRGGIDARARGVVEVLDSGFL